MRLRQHTARKVPAVTSSNALLALPGEQIEVKNNGIYVNNVKLDEAYIPLGLKRPQVNILETKWSCSTQMNTLFLEIIDLTRVIHVLGVQSPLTKSLDAPSLSTGHQVRWAVSKRSPIQPSNFQRKSRAIYFELFTWESSSSRSFCVSSKFPLRVMVILVWRVERESFTLGDEWLRSEAIVSCQRKPSWDRQRCACRERRGALFGLLDLANKFLCSAANTGVFLEQSFVDIDDQFYLPVPAKARACPQ